MTSVMQRPETDPLVVAAAASELAELRRLREVARAAEQGRTQRDIAAKLGVSQAGVHKMLIRARHTRDLFTPQPWEVALRYAAGEIGRDEMLTTFASWPWTTSHFTDPPEVQWPEQYVRGSWNDLVSAVDHGYISDEDYQVVFDRTTA